MSRVSDIITFVKPLLQREKAREEDVESIHFFRREYSYTCYGHQALALAEEYYKTKRVIRVDQGLDCLDVSRKLFSKIGGSLLERHLRVQVWHKPSPSPTAPWELKLTATHGNFEALENEVGRLERDVTSSCFVAAVKVDDLTATLLGVSLLSTVTRELHQYEFEDDGEYSKLEGLLLQYGVSLCVLCRRQQEEGEDQPETRQYVVKSVLEKTIIKAEVQLEYFDLSPSKFNKANCVNELLSLKVNSDDDSNANNKDDFLVQLHQLDRVLYASCALLQNLAIWGNKDHQNTYTVSIDHMGSYMLFDANVSEALQLFPEDIRVSTISVQDQDEDAAQTSKRGVKSVLDLLHVTRCSMGSRLLRYWLQHPLCNREQIMTRQQLIRTFLASPSKLAMLRDSRDHLKHFPDLERIVLRLRVAKASSTAAWAVLKDMVDLYKAVHKARTIHGLLLDILQDSPVVSDEFLQMTQQMQTLLGKYDRYLCLVEELLDAEHMQNVSNGRPAKDSSVSSQLLLHRDRFFRVKPSFSPSLRSLFNNMKDTEAMVVSEYHNAQKLTSLDAKELHLEDSDIHGWHLRVTKRISNKTLKSLDTQKIPYEVLSNQKAGTLFVTKKLKTLLIKYNHLREEYQGEQRQVVFQALTVSKTYFCSVLQLSKLVATVDVAAALANVALERDWVAPTLLEGEDRHMQITGIRHPLLEEQLGSLCIVKNQVCVDPHKFVTIISGPNMGGKSTYMRSIGIVAYLAQVGSYVPASSASLPVFDKLFVRAGSRDCSLLGISSFMAEMNDAADILQHATAKSLVLIDELGRGTSITDGFGIAWSILEELAFRNQATTFCATHYHELNLLQDAKPPADNGGNPFVCLHVEAAVDERNDQVTMLYEIREGPSDSSYGIHVAKAAKFPVEIVSRASDIEHSLEAAKVSNAKRSLDYSEYAIESSKRLKC